MYSYGPQLMATPGGALDAAALMWANIPQRGGLVGKVKMHRPQTDRHAPGDPPGAPLLFCAQDSLEFCKPNNVNALKSFISILFSSDTQWHARDSVSQCVSRSRERSFLHTDTRPVKGGWHYASVRGVVTVGTAVTTLKGDIWGTEFSFQC